MRAKALLVLFSALTTLAKSEEIHVSAYYYPWYHSDGRHWSEGYAGSGSDREPDLGEYSSRSIDTVHQHIAWSSEFGIDNWICSWWGPDSWEDVTLRTRVLPELANAAEAGRPPTFCILYEAEGILGLDPAKGIAFDAAKTGSFVSHFRFLADRYFSHPAYQRIGGKPVVYVYLSRAFTGDYGRALLRARAAVEARGFKLYLVGDEVYWGEPEADRIARFDAITAYNMHGPTNYAGTTDWSGFVRDCGKVYQTYQSVAKTEGVAFIPGVVPGFDTRGRHYTIPRELRPGSGPGSTLAAFLELAKTHLDPEISSIAVTSFNEWHEGTQLEPSRAGENGGGILRAAVE